MSPRVKIPFIIGYILLFAGCYISLDWSRLFLITTHSMEYHESFLFVKILKLITSFSCALLAWSDYKYCNSKSDSRRIKLAFVIIFCGDLSFTTGLPIVGVTTFALGQLLLSIRNSNGIKAYFKSGKYKNDKMYLCITAIIILLIDLFLLTVIFHKNINNKWVFIGFTFYSIILSLSVWISWASKKIDYFDNINSTMILVGMTCFFFCDFTVGYGILANNNVLKEMLTSTTWIFYTPALILLSLSSYNFRKLKTLTSNNN